MANQGLIIKVDIISITLKFTQFIKGIKKVFFNISQAILFVILQRVFMMVEVLFEALN